MGEIYNCRITEVEEEIKKDLSISVKVDFTCPVHTTVHCFTYTFHNVKENNEFQKLRQYTGTEKIENLKGQVIRLVVDNYYEDFLGFGDPLWDDFILFANPSKSYTEAELNK